MTDPAFVPNGLACELNAIDPAGRERHTEVLAQLRPAIEQVEPLPDGYGLRLPADDRVLMLAAEFITRERRCCPFFQFTLDVTPDGGPVWLRLTGREGVKDFIQSEFFQNPRMKDS